MDGLIEALGEPGVVFQLRHALSAGTGPFGKKAVGQTGGVLEEVHWGVPQGVTEQECRKCDYAQQQSKGPDFSPIWFRHVATSESEVWDGFMKIFNKIDTSSLQGRPNQSQANPLCDSVSPIQLVSESSHVDPVTSLIGVSSIL